MDKGLSSVSKQLLYQQNFNYQLLFLTSEHFKSTCFIFAHAFYIQHVTQLYKKYFHIVYSDKYLLKINVFNELFYAFLDCDDIDDKSYAELSKEKTKYRCVLCRGEKEERMDSFARKNRDHEASQE